MAAAIFNRAAAAKLKELLENKHLYQKVSFDVSKEILELIPKLQAGHLQHFDPWMRSIFVSPLPAGTHQQFDRAVSGGVVRELPMLLLQNVKLYCSQCDRREAFLPLWHTEAIGPIRQADPEHIIQGSTPSDLQLFMVVYQCQSCKGIPEAFLIRRTGWELQLHGRSPMEGLEVPKYIPKPEYNLFRDSVIAFNSGKVLAALFYLRSFIEQFARRVTGLTGKITGDKIMDTYNETIPLKFRDSMPSLREYYDSLSVPIHQAKDDAEVFEAQRQAIEKHFEIRKVFDIHEGPMATAGVGKTADSKQETAS